jgi:peptidoglycan/LPS O-acetylase OafA/YrhL
MSGPLRPGTLAAASVGIPTQSPGRFYLPVLDALRLLAFLLVLVHHLPEATFAPVIVRVQRIGWVGVDLFFVISTYLFFRLLSLEQARTGGVDVLRFYARRALRIWPAYAVFVLLSYGWSVAVGPFEARELLPRLIGLALFVDNFMMWVNGFNPLVNAAHLWTLSFEEQVYIVIPGVFAIVMRVGRRRFLLVAMAGLGCAAVLRAAFIMLLPQSHMVVWPTPFLRPEAVVLGALLGLGLLDDLLAHIPPVTRLALGFLFVSFVMLSPPIMAPGAHRFHVYYPSAVGWLLVVSAALEARGLDTLRGMSPVLYLGKVSYGLYLYHLVGLTVAFRVLEATTVRGPGAWWLLAAVAFAVTVAIALVSYEVLERPVLRFKERFAIVPSRPA